MRTTAINGYNQLLRTIAINSYNQFYWGQLLSMVTLYNKFYWGQLLSMVTIDFSEDNCYQQLQSILLKIATGNRSKHHYEWKLASECKPHSRKKNRGGERKRHGDRERERKRVNEREREREREGWWCEEGVVWIRHTWRLLSLSI